MKHARITFAERMTLAPSPIHKSLTKALEDANKYLNKLVAARKKEERLTITAMHSAIKLSLSKAKIVDDVMKISFCHVYSGAGIDCFNVFVEDKRYLCFNVAIDTL